MSEHGSTTIYFVIFGILMVLLAATVGVAYIPLGEFNALVALTIAAIKAALVLLYFMHVRQSSRLTWIFAGAGFVWLGLMIGITMSDYVSRQRLPPDIGLSDELDHPGRTLTTGPAQLDASHE